MRFNPSQLDSTVVDLALRQRLHASPPDQPIPVILELRHGALLAPPHPEATPVGDPARGRFKALLRSDAIHALAFQQPALYKIWLDHTVRALTTRSLATIQADAALTAFHATGRGILFAVADSGIAPHSHFDAFRNLVLPPGVDHRDFTGGNAPLTDDYGHGTHVAGIIGGIQSGCSGGPRGVAPETTLLSLKVLGQDGSGLVSDILAALDYIQTVNDHGRRLRVHGLNLSVGYDFDPEWYACGASPLCVEVDRLVHSGVAVVAAAGNSGYGFQNSLHLGPVPTCLPLTINDPGNADLAITVGSTHRDMPHTYGVSYFSSKGPTGDGRRKPDLIAPGERILSCSHSDPAAYIEDSGTSMAAPHVSGAIAAFLSARREFIGRPQAVKEVLLSTATDLCRHPDFQGRGLINVFRALQER
ncbi:MAG: S8 family peptidase [Acidobacteria bacterium]|nr:S8 family peptidase [Acidobacteriota bacterium]